MYLKPKNLYPKEDWQISCMYFKEFFFIPQTPVAVFQGTFGTGFGTTDIQWLSATVTTWLENTQSGKNICL